ncbi:Adaptor complexes medium subunit family protein [Spironucleus salmonicida]|uniref:Adaptor complexes medium subunit family protein n=1 Tax=Spironucleus salmonicida TaxID=348837 RepID=V6LJ48_9EUKA|nr:Adaptor complexes medium subunit family protein [Spironucleus salmonicida]|eukprot:EST44597.1 Adaptor complexes medium subunit family protein [Spironucleus salmonicida]
MPINSISIYSGDGHVIIHRDYCHKTTTADFQLLRSYVLAGNVQEPVFTTGSRVYAYKKQQLFHFFASISAESDCMAAVYFLQKIWEVMISFYGGEQLTVEDITTTQIFFQEMLDEMVDNGEIVTTDPEVLKLFIQQGEPTVKKIQEQEVTIQATKQVNYRSADIKYKNNEISLELVEKLNSLYSQTGDLLHADVTGQININCQLSGMPDCQISLNDRQMQQQQNQTFGASASELSKTKQKQISPLDAVVLDDTTFHQCVRLNNFAEKRQITFTPPDGQFTLMNFRISEQIRQPLKIRPSFVAHGRSRGTANFVVFSDLLCSDVRILVPTPQNLNQCIIQNIKQGKAKLRKEGDFVEWRIGNLESGIQAELQVEFNTETVQNEDLREWKKPHILMNFEVPMYTASGVEIRVFTVNMGVSGVNDKVNKELKMKTVSGTYASKW